MSILNDTLKSFDYYKNKLPLYLQNSHGFIVHFRIWYDLLTGNNTSSGIVPMSDMLLALLNIFDKDYLSTIQNLEGINNTDEPYGTKCDILDKLATLVGVKRNFSVTYTTANNEIVDKQLNLTNDELLILIKTQIVKNNCDGTYEQMVGYYKDVGLEILPLCTDTSGICYLLFQSVPDSEYVYSQNILDMFYSGLLTIPSMGIQYITTTIDINNLLIWDSNTQGSRWDEGVWSV